MESLLKPIYYQNQVTTRANHYYSPKAQLNAYHKELNENPNHIIHPPVPKWVTTMSPIQINGLKKSDDLAFFFK